MNITREKVEEILRLASFGIVQITTKEGLDAFVEVCKWALNRDTAAKMMADKCTETERELASAQNALCEIRETVEAFQKGQGVPSSKPIKIPNEALEHLVFPADFWDRTKITETDGASEQ